jgi:hypothetical protein
MTRRTTKLAFIALLTLFCYVAACPVAEQARSTEGITFADSLKAELQTRTSAIFAKSCAVAGCHRGSYPKAKLRLEPETFAEALRDAPSRQVDSLSLIDTRSPGKSYLVMKVRGIEGIKGERMPIDAPALSEEQIQTIEIWAASLAVLEKGSKAPAPAASDKKKALPASGADERRIQTSAFFGNTLINIPTTTVPGRGEMLFRISHRFIYPTNAGHELFLGLDGPAYIFASLGYGISDRVSVTLGRTNLLDEIELSSKIAVVRQGQDGSVPFSAALAAGLALTTARPEGAGLFEADDMHYTVQLALSRQFTGRLSLLCVPSFAYNTDYAHPTEESTTGLGLGGRFMIIDNVSIIGEWAPVLGGAETGTDAWGLGIEAKEGGHVFHVFVTDVYGLTPNQYLPGGDPNDNGDVRIGFNIYRTL